ncbi:MAG: tyrosine-type recombinase/integrase [Anaerovorax sp.]|nr:tyrosine-type recombinase/integrase [Anaerovorax sp.]
MLLECTIDRSELKRLQSHMFIHKFAYNYLLNGGDVFRLQKLMIHNDISITKGYLNLSLEDLQVGFEEHNIRGFDKDQEAY